MVQGRWITPDEIPAETICRVLFIPNELEIVASVNGALCELIYARNWEQVGAVTPAEMSEAMQTMFWDYEQSECNFMQKPDIFYDQKAQNTHGGGISANVLTDIFFQTANSLNAGFVTGGAPNFIVSPGLYEYDIWHVIRGDAVTQMKCLLLNDDTANVVQVGLTDREDSSNFCTLRVTGMVNVAAETEFVYQIISSDALASTALGLAMNVTSLVEVYGQAVWRRLGAAE